MKQNVTFIISAKLEYNEGGRVVIKGYYLMRVHKNLLGLNKFHIMREFDQDHEAVDYLNKFIRKAK